MSTLVAAPPARQVSLYSPPAGYYDLPFMWVFDGSNLTDGSTSLNNKVSIYAGYGDFIMRRVVGLNRVLAAGPPPGQFQIRDAKGRYLEEKPQYVGTGGAVGSTQSTRDLAIVPEVRYEENSQINFDLYNIARAADGGGDFFGAQIGFHGVRRLPGVSPYQASYRYRPKHYAYNTETLLTFPETLVGTTNGTKPTIVYQTVDNYDFELHEIRMIYVQQASGQHAQAEPVSEMIIFAVPPGALGNGIQLIVSGSVPAFQALTITVNAVARTVTVLLQTDGLGNVLTTMGGLATALNAIPAVTALFTSLAVADLAALVSPPWTITTSGGGVLVAPTVPNALMQLYDQHRVQVWSAPVIDFYVNRIGPYANGALVPPLVYQKEAIIQMDVYSLLGAGSLPLSLVINYIGIQRIPC